MSKTCSDCNITKSLNEFYVSKGGVNNRASKCKQCSWEATKKSRQKKKERQIPENIFEGTKECVSCGKTKEKLEFRKDAERDDFLFGSCKGCESLSRIKRYNKMMDGVEIPEDVHDGTKECYTCHKVLDKTEFHIKAQSTDRLDTSCKTCKNNKYNEMMIAVHEIKKEMGGKCIKCGTCDIRVIQFDHISDKTNSISHMKNIDEIREEAKKCQLLCSFCHHVKSATDGKYKSEQPTTKTGKIKLRNYNHVDNIKLRIGKCNSCDRLVNKEIKEELCAYHFDHLDPKDKCANISLLCANGRSLEAISNEIEKCQLLCANCHMLRTIEQFDQYAYLEPKN